MVTRHVVVSRIIHTYQFDMREAVPRQPDFWILPYLYLPISTRTNTLWMVCCLAIRQSWCFPDLAVQGVRMHANIVMCRKSTTTNVEMDGSWGDAFTGEGDGRMEHKRDVRVAEMCGTGGGVPRRM
jgi:hypothetical protein